MESVETVLRIAEEFLDSDVRPNANLIDGDEEALGRALQGLRDRNLMALRRPVEFGGPELDEMSFRLFQESVARRSGSLAFLQTQHQSAVSLLARGPNEALKQDYLPHMAGAEKLVGIGFSQLRRPGPPICWAEKVPGGYRVTGQVPWVTGYSFFPEFMIGASLPDGRSVFGIVPFVPAPGITFGEPMKLAAMESAMTVVAELDSLFLPDSLVVDVKPAGWIIRNDQINITLQGFFALGCARGGIDVILACFAKKDKPFLKEAAVSLTAEVDSCRASLVAAQAKSEDTTDEKLRLRAWAIDLAMRCAHAAVAASGGSANMSGHPAQRLVREAIVFTVTAQTEGIMSATLARLTGERVGG